jgi:hypothetical protein
MQKSAWAVALSAQSEWREAVLLAESKARYAYEEASLR